MKLTAETVASIQTNTDNIRNICILAHVDHGKTSLSDSLLATNGIISQRMAGKVRYLDSREDEQTRGITMEASAISLYFRKMMKRQEEVETKEYLINLIDLPGHIDFSFEVSTASRLCDGAIVLVDVVEGVCSQTVTVLRQCWADEMKPILVLNKIDRLFLEWKLTPSEAYQHLTRTIEQVNSVIGMFFSLDRMKDDLDWRENGGEMIERTDDEIYFSPEKNNVIFASAIDGWAFTVNTFARIYAAKLGFSQNALSKTLWGDFYLDMKNKKIIPGKKLKANSNQKPMFVSLALEPIWSVYENCITDRDQDKLEQIINKLGAKISPRDLRSKDFKTLLNNIMSQWLPISHALLGTVIDILPSPVQSQQKRMARILDQCLFELVDFESKEEVLDQTLENALNECKSDLQVVAYVSKLISIPEEELPREKIEVGEDEMKERSIKARMLAKQLQESANEAKEEEVEVPKSPFQFEYEEEQESSEEEEEEVNEVIIGFTRVYSGILSVGDKVVVVGPKYNPTLPLDDSANKQQVFSEVEIEDLYLIMGRDLIKVNSVPAGNIAGVRGLDGTILKNGTIMSQFPSGKPYLNLGTSSTLMNSRPIVRIAIEPTNPSKLTKLEKGLDLLSRADPVFEWTVDEDSGELIVCVAGELHLERCLKDLSDRFAKDVSVTVKEPVIPYREGVTNRSSIVTSEEACFSFEIEPLPQPLVKFLTEHEKEISQLTRFKVTESELMSFKQKLVTIAQGCEFHSVYKSVEEFVDRLVCFGPKRIGPNMLVEDPNSDLLRHLFGDKRKIENEYENCITAGFQLSANQGPLAAEPLQGVLVRVKVKGDTSVSSGRLITVARDLISKALLESSPRLLLATYTCEIQASTEVLGKVYAVVQKRHGSIISEEMKEGTPFFTIEAKLPVMDAFGFSEDVRKKTSGAASPQLVFDGFEVLDIDPFWVPHTEEELEELGEFAERENVARRYMIAIRRRKGLFVDEKVVTGSEKQRNLKKD